MNSPLAPNAALRWSVVRRLVEQAAPASIVEIGCGQGAFGARLARRAAYTGVEPDPSSFAVSQERVSAAGGQMLNCAAEDLPAGSSFDLVCAFEVLEHLEDESAALKTWHSLVAPGGHLLISMPAWQERFSSWDEMVGHYRRYSPGQCRAALENAGFNEVTVKLYGWPLGFATETVRNRIALRRQAQDESAANLSMQDRTARSGRLLQPRALAALAVQAGTAPFCALQRARPTTGTGLVALAARPR